MITTVINNNIWYTYLKFAKIVNLKHSQYMKRELYEMIDKLISLITECVYQSKYQILHSEYI